MDNEVAKDSTANVMIEALFNTFNSTLQNSNGNSNIERLCTIRMILHCLASLTKRKQMRRLIARMVTQNEDDTNVKNESNQNNNSLMSLLVFFTEISHVIKNITLPIETEYREHEKQKDRKKMKKCALQLATCTLSLDITSQIFQNGDENTLSFDQIKYIFKQIQYLPSSDPFPKFNLIFTQQKQSQFIENKTERTQTKLILNLGDTIDIIHHLLIIFINLSLLTRIKYIFVKPLDQQGQIVKSEQNDEQKQQSQSCLDSMLLIVSSMTNMLKISERKGPKLYNWKRREKQRKMGALQQVQAASFATPRSDAPSFATPRESFSQFSTPRIDMSHNRLNPPSTLNSTRSSPNYLNSTTNSEQIQNKGQFNTLPRIDSRAFDQSDDEDDDFDDDDTIKESVVSEKTGKQYIQSPLSAQDKLQDESSDYFRSILPPPPLFGQVLLLLFRLFTNLLYHPQTQQILLQQNFIDLSAQALKRHFSMRQLWSGVTENQAIEEDDEDSQIYESVKYSLSHAQQASSTSPQNLVALFECTVFSCISQLADQINISVNGNLASSLIFQTLPSSSSQAMLSLSPNALSLLNQFKRANFVAFVTSLIKNALKAIEREKDEKTEIQQNESSLLPLSGSKSLDLLCSSASIFLIFSADAVLLNSITPSVIFAIPAQIPPVPAPVTVPNLPKSN
ncbi:MAG: hypothetical protein EZS28_018651, partial [Streblomastix strix]